MKKTITYTMILFIVIILFLMLQNYKQDISDEFPRITNNVEFVIKNLEGSWEGPGLMHFSDTSSMVINGSFDFFYDEEKDQYMTSINIEGHEYYYSDYGIFTQDINNDSTKWEIRDNNEQLLTYKGKIEGNVLFMEYPTPNYTYKMLLYFRTNERVYFATELYKDNMKHQWMEFTLEKIEE